MTSFRSNLCPWEGNQAQQLTKVQAGEIYVLLCVYRHEYIYTHPHTEKAGLSTANLNSINSFLSALNSITLFLWNHFFQLSLLYPSKRNCASKIRFVMKTHGYGQCEPLSSKKLVASSETIPHTRVYRKYHYESAKFLDFQVEKAMDRLDKWKDMEEEEKPLLAR